LKWVIPDSVWYDEALLGQAEALELLSRFRTEINWTQQFISLYGKRMKCPRLSAWHGDENAVYSYSGMTLHPEPWNEELLRLKEVVEIATEMSFNSVLLNLYRDGSDSMGWHADDEPELGERPCIASVSLGAERTFRLKKRPLGKALRKADPIPSGVGQPTHSPESISIPLGNGSLLVMMGESQKRWNHSLPKTKRAVGERINLTFRLIDLSESRDTE
jgi:alkylated DNA repair dioxygenase AlkB